MKIIGYLNIMENKRKEDCAQHSVYVHSCHPFGYAFIPASTAHTLTVARNQDKNPPRRVTNIEHLRTKIISITAKVSIEYSFSKDH